MLLRKGVLEEQLKNVQGAAVMEAILANMVLTYVGIVLENLQQKLVSKNIVEEIKENVE